jgi:hypothetical protein
MISDKEVIFDQMEQQKRNFGPNSVFHSLKALPFDYIQMGHNERGKSSGGLKRWSSSFP